MYRLREMDLDDKVCDQVDLTLLAQVYPPEAIERCVGQSSRGRAKCDGCGRVGCWPWCCL